MGDQKFDGGPAFPSELNVLEKPIIGFEGEELDPNTVANYPGMMLRDYFAAKAIPTAWDAYDKGYCGVDDDRVNVDIVAECAYSIADAMLKARNA